MLIARLIKPTEHGDANIIFIGLEKKNVELLEKGVPLQIDLEQVQLSGQILIHLGDTKEDLIRDLQKTGYFPGGSIS